MRFIKYIDNILKHEKIVFEIYDILAPGMHISVKADDGKDGPIIQEVEIKPHLVWGDLSNIPVNSKYKNQRDNYINYVKKFNILECLEKIEMIINKYYYKL